MTSDCSQEGGTFCLSVLCMRQQLWKCVFTAAVLECLTISEPSQTWRCLRHQFQTTKLTGQLAQWESLFLLWSVTFLQRGDVWQRFCYSIVLFAWVVPFETNDNWLNWRAKLTCNIYSHSLIACFNSSWSQAFWNMPINSCQDHAFPVIGGWFWFLWPHFID